MKAALSRQPAQKLSSAEKPPITIPASSAPAPRKPRITTPEVRRIFAASAAGAKETPSTRGSASRRCPTERAQKSTLASAPTPGVPAKSQISWGGSAPGRLGREDARNFGGVILRSLGVRLGGEARRTLREQRPRMEHAVAAQLALGDDGDARPEDVGQRARVLHRDRRGFVLLSERHVQPAARPLHVVLHLARDTDVSGRRLRAQLRHRDVVLARATRR